MQPWIQTPILEKKKKRRAEFRSQFFFPGKTVQLSADVYQRSPGAHGSSCSLSAGGIPQDTLMWFKSGDATCHLKDLTGYVNFYASVSTLIESSHGYFTDIIDIQST
jgi:hypothetical protein